LMNSTFLALGISVVVGRILAIIRRRRRRESGHT
jgi:hypothetical protein